MDKSVLDSITVEDIEKGLLEAMYEGGKEIWLDAAVCGKGQPAKKKRRTRRNKEKHDG